MNSTLDKLKSLYEQFDRHQAAGDDVVAEIRSEINNLELSYLKEDVFPEMVKFFANRIKDIKCRIDFSFVLNGDNELEYTFCTSGSTLIVRDKVKINEVASSADNLPFSSSYAQSASNKYITNASPDPSIEGNRLIRIEPYSEKIIVVYGDTKQYAEYFKNHGGYYNPQLKGGAGWVFSNKRENEIRNYIYRIQGDIPDNILKSTVKPENDFEKCDIDYENNSNSRKFKYQGKLRKIITKEFTLDSNNPVALITDFVARIGAKRVYDMKIPYCGHYLVDTFRNPKYFSQCKFLDGGYWLNTCSGTAKKIEQMEKIAHRLNMEIKFIME